MASTFTEPSEAVDDLSIGRDELGTMFPDHIALQNLSVQEKRNLQNSLELLDRIIHHAQTKAETPFFASKQATERFQKALLTLAASENWGDTSVEGCAAEKGDINTSRLNLISGCMLLNGRIGPVEGHGRVWNMTEDMAMSCMKSNFHERRSYYHEMHKYRALVRIIDTMLPRES
ncbi:AAA family ATPase [Fusarium austroafricanum]|uniref:AAA family ATPase n=1 Tax=Fusarium austroafricanum TaxID=2364996 RepID=A0A8H4KGE8_9HYPO|nr:AAA family ATPase [Fusarium austroafricanum]